MGMREYVIILGYEMFFYLLGLFSKYRGYIVKIPSNLSRVIILSGKVHECSVSSIFMCAYMEVMPIITLLFALIIAPDSTCFIKNLNLLVLFGFIFGAGVVCVGYIKSDVDKLLDKILLMIASIIFALISLLILVAVVIDFCQVF